MGSRPRNEAEGCGRCGFSAVVDLTRRPRRGGGPRVEVSFRDWQRAAPLQYFGKRLRRWLDDFGRRLTFGRSR